jgi:hypothetical protein
VLVSLLRQHRYIFGVLIRMIRASEGPNFAEDEEHVIPWRADLWPFGCSNGQVAVVIAELENIDALGLVSGVSHRWKRYPGNLSDVRPRYLE